MSIEDYQRMMSNSGFEYKMLKIGEDYIISHQHESEIELRIYISNNGQISIRLRSLKEMLEIVPKFIIRNAIRQTNNEFLLQKIRIFQCGDSLKHEIISASFKVGIKKSLQLFSRLLNRIHQDCEKFKESPKTWLNNYDPQSVQKLEKVHFIQKSNIFLDIDQAEYFRRFGEDCPSQNFIVRIIISPPCDWECKHHIRAIKLDPKNKSIFMIEREDNVTDLKTLVDNIIDEFSPNVSRITGSELFSIGEKESISEIQNFIGSNLDKTIIISKQPIPGVHKDEDEMQPSPRELIVLQLPEPEKPKFVPENNIAVPSESDAESTHYAYEEAPIDFDIFN